MDNMKILLVATLLCSAEFTKAAEFIVTDYGAVADGTTDCSPAIAAAIEAAGAAGGGTIVLPAADKPYVITDTIHLRTDNLHLTAAGATVYLKDGSSIGRTTPENMLHVVWIHGTPERPVENVRLDGLSIDANYWGQTGNVSSWQGSRAVAGITRGIKIHHARHIKIDNIAIRRPFVGMTFGLGSHYCHASNITVTEFHHDAFGVTPGYVTAGATHITYEGCTAADSMNGAKGGLPGIRIKGWEIEEGAQNIKVIDCTVRNTSANGFYIRPHSAHTNFVTKNIELIRCRVENAGDLAFNVQSATADQPVSNVTLTDCSTDTGDLAMQMNADQVLVQGGNFRHVAIGYYSDYDDPHHFRFDPNTKDGFTRLPIKTVRFENVTIAGDLRINATEGHDGHAPFSPDTALTNVRVGGDLYIVGSAAPPTLTGCRVDGEINAVTTANYFQALEDTRIPIELSSGTMSLCAEPPTVDGQLEDACWRGGQPNDITNHYERPVRSKSGHTFVRMCYDDRAIYVAFDCRESEMDKLRTTATRRDADLWEDDCIELFIHRDRDAPNYFRQWMISAAGVIYDGDKATGEAWTSNVAAAARQYDDRFVIELGIPWTDLGGKLQAGEQIRANFVRNRTTDGNRYIWSWQYDGKGAFGDVAKMGTVSIK